MVLANLPLWIWVLRDFGLVIAGGLIGALVPIFIQWLRRPLLEIEYEDRERFRIIGKIEGEDYVGVFVRAKVTNKGRTEATRCRGKMVYFYSPRVDGRPENSPFDPILLDWACTRSEPISLHRKEWEWLDLFFVRKHPDHKESHIVMKPEREMRRGPRGFPNEYLPGTYRFEVVVYGEQAKSDSKIFEVELSEDFSQVKTKIVG